MSNIVLPNNWTPRPFQKRVFSYMESGKPYYRKRAVLVCHRRAGKDAVAMNLAARAAFMRIGQIVHFLPEYAQARKAIWQGVNAEGKRFIDQAFPESIRVKTNDQEMRIEFVNGSSYQLAGSDSYNRIVGSNQIGMVFSEYSIANPAAWDYMRPILRENGGWAMFLYTPRGNNHGKNLYDMAESNDQWFATFQTIEDTGLLTPEDIQEEREAGMSEDKIQQEYYCSWLGGLEGAFYTDEYKKLNEDGRLGHFPYDPSLPVHTHWDIGQKDNTVVLFSQTGKDGYTNIIDMVHSNNHGLQFYIAEVLKKNYLWGKHFAPHDMFRRDFNSAVEGELRSDTAKRLGLPMVKTSDMLVENGIEAVRRCFMKIRINAEPCQRLMEAMPTYRRIYNEKTQRFSDKPYHDWASDYMDAFRYMCINIDEGRTTGQGSTNESWNKPLKYKSLGLK